MNRTKDKPDDRPRNPLALAMGRVLEELRERENLETSDVAARLSLKYSSYRMVETGVMPLRPARALSLAHALDLDWPRLTEITVAVQVCEDALAPKRGELPAPDERLRETLKSLFDRAPHLRSVLAMPEAVLTQLHDARTVEAALEDAGVIRRLEVYLRNEDASASVASAQMNRWDAGRFFEGIAPGYLLDLADYLLALRRRPPPPVTLEGLADFEFKQTRERGFTRIYGLLRDEAVLHHTISDQNFKFTWEYLLQPQFEFLGILIVADGASPTTMDEATLVQGLTSLWQRTQPTLSENDRARALGKLSLTTVRETDPVCQLLRDEASFAQVEPGTATPLFGSGESLPMANLWLYELERPNLALGVTDNLGSADRPYAATMSWERTLEAVTSLERAWSAELAERGLELRKKETR